tara:strand:+ start:132 stop:776 length:645 start_codon:yes stop_codon:yes gene_type:complete
MSCLPLPDELIRKVYGYILPIFDYIEFIKISAMQRKEESEAYHGSNQLLLQLEDLNYNSSVVDISTKLQDKIFYYNYIIDYGIKMNERLHQIQRFINDNPLFKKYAKGRILAGLTPSVNEQENQVSNIEKKISEQRSKVCLVGDIGTFKRIVLYDDLVKILNMRGQCLETITRHCKFNNIPVITGPYSDLQIKAAGWLNEEDYRNYLVRKLIAL